LAALLNSGITLFLLVVFLVQHIHCFINYFPNGTYKPRILTSINLRLLKVWLRQIQNSFRVTNQSCCWYYWFGIARCQHNNFNYWQLFCNALICNKMGSTFSGAFKQWTVKVEFWAEYRWCWSWFRKSICFPDLQDLISV
jgi:hypothetical protein